MDIAQLGVEVDTRKAVKATQDLDRLGDQAGRTEKRVRNLAGGMAGMGRQANSSSRAFSGLATPLRQTSLQFSQVVQQTQATGNFFQALAIQLPDIGIQFGTIGIAAGVAAGTLLSLATNLFGTGSASNNLKDRMEGLEGIMSELDESFDILTASASDLRDRYGEAADAVRRFAAQQAQLRLAQLNSQLQEQASVLRQVTRLYVRSTDAGRDYRNLIQRLSADFAISVAAARDFEAALESAATSATLDEQASALRRVFDILEANGVAASEIPPELANALDEMISLVRETRAAEQAANKVASAAKNITNDVGNAANEASRLAFNLANALNLSNDVAAGLINRGVANGSLPPQAAQDAPQTNLESLITDRSLGQIEERRRALEIERRRASRDSSSGIDRRRNELLRERDQILQGLKTAEDRHNDSVAQARRLLDAKVLTQEEYNRQIAQLKRDLNDIEFAELHRGIDDISRTLGDMLVDFENFGDSAANIMRQLASDIYSAGIREALLSSFNIPAPSAGFGGGGGLGALFAGFFDQGGNIPAGQFGIVGERGPEPVFGPASVMGRQEFSNALRNGGSGEGRMHVSVSVDGDGNLRALVRDQAGRVVAESAPSIVRESVGQVDRALRSTRSFGNL